MLDPSALISAARTESEKMHELVESIMLNGLLVPITVRPLEDGDLNPSATFL